jgi:hypothetical protein
MIFMALLLALLSKIFELCIHDRYGHFLLSSRNQFGLKKGIGCNHAIHTLHNAAAPYITGSITINVRAIDLTKAFDKVDHNALYISLMKRHIPPNLLDTFILLSIGLGSLCHILNGILCTHHFLKLNCGVRQGPELVPYLFTVYLDDRRRSFDFNRETFIIVYADVILSIAPSVCELQKLLLKCDKELTRIGMSINTKQSCCLRIGSRCAVSCTSIRTTNGMELPWCHGVP